MMKNPHHDSSIKQIQPVPYKIHPDSFVFTTPPKQTLQSVHSEADTSPPSIVLDDDSITKKQLSDIEDSMEIANEPIIIVPENSSQFREVSFNPNNTVICITPRNNGRKVMRKKRRSTPKKVNKIQNHISIKDSNQA